MEDLIRTIARAVREYGFDKERASKSLLEIIELERSFIAEMEQNFPQAAIERKLDLLNLEILCITLMQS